MSEREWPPGVGRRSPRRLHVDPSEVVAWDVVEAARPILGRRTRSSLFVALGAGESNAVIVDVLRAVATRGQHLPSSVVGRIAAWLDGYAGARDELILRDLFDRVVETATLPSLQSHEEPDGIRR
ncbi:hypothetical protein H7K45_24905 [Mycobacterium yunnanensis]|uniref:Uncharacterized protein n=1 Tax=Mycobacterium yunnanensis TaxID=368477 RepID=A0A9X3BVJ2_9MYCO|nr:hypothetical protein [Mycobacterium yunnanensis]MCV7423799.1 hypothetical protein [Mycobacterium yunnanensis]